MEDPYSRVKEGRLKFKKKFEKKAKKAKKSASNKPTEEQTESDLCTLRHGGWWHCKQFVDVHGSVALEMGDMKYVRALDNGLLTLGAEHGIGEGPDAEEIFTAFRVDDTLLVLKSGFGKYLGLQSDGRVVARQDAVMKREQWLPVFQDGKTALQGCNDRFLTVADDGGIFCSSETASDNQFVRILSCRKKEQSGKKDEDAGKLVDVEMNYIKKYQSYGGKRMNLNVEDRKTVKRARLDGNLHEALLDRRSKMKSDKFCY